MGLLGGRLAAIVEGLLVCRLWQRDFWDPRPGIPSEFSLAGYRTLSWAHYFGITPVHAHASLTRLQESRAVGRPSEDWTLHPGHLAQGLQHGRQLIHVWWINEWMNNWYWLHNFDWSLQDGKMQRPVCDFMPPCGMRSPPGQVFRMIHYLSQTAILQPHIGWGSAATFYHVSM